MYNRREPLNPRLTANECKMKTKKKNPKNKTKPKNKKKYKQKNYRNKKTPKNKTALS